MQSTFNFVVLLVAVVLLPVSAAAQSATSVRGNAIDRETRTAVAGVAVRVLDTKFGAIARSDGSFEVKNVPAGSYSVQAAAVGYSPRVYADVVVRPGRITFLDIELEPRAATTESVTVEGDYFQSAAAVAPASTLSFSTEEIRRAPGSAGDISRVLNASPSVARVDDNRNDIAVRGGSALENAFYIDNIPFATINYFPKYGATGGSISFVNIDAVRSTDFMTSGYGAGYNALSSVIDIKLRNGNDEQFDLQADFNMIGVGVGVEGPLGEKSSYFLSVQRGYFDLLRNFLEQSGVPRWGNAQAKVAIDAGQNDKISLLGFSVISDFHRDSTEGRQADSRNKCNRTFDIGQKYFIRRQKP